MDVWREGNVLLLFGYDWRYEASNYDHVDGSQTWSEDDPAVE
jgi:hypothetical protein